MLILHMPVWPTAENKLVMLRLAIGLVTMRSLPQYVDRVVASRTAALVAEVKAAGVDVVATGVEGESAARSVLEAVSEHKPDLLCVGTHGLGRFEGLLGSLSTKLARLAPCPVLLLR